MMQILCEFNKCHITLIGINKIIKNVVLFGYSLLPFIIDYGTVKVLKDKSNWIMKLLTAVLVILTIACNYILACVLFTVADHIQS